MYQNYSVLMSVYIKENPEHLRQSIRSMMEQTVPTNDFVLVCDGPLTIELDLVIAKYEKDCPDIFHVIRLEKNQGLGNALNIGLQACKNELVARMDSDDISLPGRCEMQLQLFSREPKLAFSSGSIAEFYEDINHIMAVRRLPTDYKDIVVFAKKRNPMNHMAVVFKKSAVIDAGNYIEISLAEDYYLWVRMLQKGYLAENLDDILVYARTGITMVKRRGGIDYVKKMFQLQFAIKKTGFISWPTFINNCCIRLVVGMAPSGFRLWIYERCLRKSIL